MPRLGFKGLCTQDSPQGVRDADYVSAFTSSQLAGATWDRELLYNRGRAMGQEHKDKGSTVQLGPVAGPLGRVALGGRIWEGFAADPFLSGIAMAETIRGIQDVGVIASAKHFITNEQEHFRQVSEAAGWGDTISEPLSSNLDDRTMHELYLWAFADAVRAGVGSILCSYNQINNSYGCQNSKTLNNLLKGELGFQGFVVSDWGGHPSGVSSALAGLDMSMPGELSSRFDGGYSYWGGNLTIAVLNGTVPEWRVDDMVMRIMAAYFKVGNTIEGQPDVNFNSWTTDTYGYKYYYPQEGYEQVNWHVDVRGDHHKAIRETAARGTVLLKNEGVLPLATPKFVAVIGEDAGQNKAGPNGCSDRSCDNGTLAMGWGSGTSNFPYLVTPDSAIQAQVLSYGGRYESVFDNWDLDAVTALASEPDATCIVFGNADSGEGYLSVDDNVGDRNNMTLWQNADALIANVSSVCNNTILVVHSGGPVLLADYNDNPNITAIVWAGLPGQESGNALVDILWGSVNPAGRSVFTWAKQASDYGTEVLYTPNNGEGPPQQEYTEGVYIDYRHFDKEGIEPVFEFGYGLSYTTFNYSNLQITRRSVDEYESTSGYTISAPTLGNYSTTLSDYGFPSDLRYIPAFIYPYLNTTTSLEEASLDPEYGRSDFIPDGALDSSAQALLPAADTTSPGGNAMLYDVMYDVTATITNTGNLAGDEVAQLYVDLGGDNPPRQLRGFDRLSIKPGQSATFHATLNRRDLSNWDVAAQDWRINDETKTVYVGSSSRKTPLSATLS